MKTPNNTQDIVVSTSINAYLEKFESALEANTVTPDGILNATTQLSNAIQTFNTCLESITGVVTKFNNGKVMKDQAATEMLPSVKSLKELCTAYGVADESSNADDITEKEIATLHGILVGSRALVNTKAETLPSMEAIGEVENMLPNDIWDDEDDDDLDEDLDDIANESAMDQKAIQYLSSPQVKTATELVKSAKKLYAYGSKERAVEYMQKAKKTYQQALAKVKSDRAFRTATVTNGAVVGLAGASYMLNANTEKKKAITDNYKMSAAVNVLENKIDLCEAYLLQWQNKAGNKDFQETKRLLKEERKQARAKRREMKKGLESMDTMTDTLDMNLDALDALEASMALNYEESDFAPATEAATDDLDAAMLAMEASITELGADADVADESMESAEALLDSMIAE